MTPVRQIRYVVTLLGRPADGHDHQMVLVATCHMHWDPEYCDVKLIQTMMLMHELRALIQQLQQQYDLRCHGNKCLESEKFDCNVLPLILCGDMNSLPESGI